MNLNANRTRNADRIAELENIVIKSKAGPYEFTTILVSDPVGEQQARQSVFSSTLNYLGHKWMAPVHIAKILEVAARRRVEIKRSRHGGAECYKSATFMRVNRYVLSGSSEPNLGLTGFRLSPDEVAEVIGKPMVETFDLAEVGLQSGGLKVKDGEEQFVVLEGRGFHQICAPTKGQTTRATAVILWEPLNEEDMSPTSDKIVSLSLDLLPLCALTIQQIGAIVYSPESVCKAFASDQEYSEAEIRATQDLLMCVLLAQF